MQPKQTGEAYNSLIDRWDPTTFNMANGILQHERALKFVNKGQRELGHL